MINSSLAHGNMAVPSIGHEDASALATRDVVEARIRSRPQARETVCKGWRDGSQRVLVHSLVVEISSAPSSLSSANRSCEQLCFGERA